MKKSVLFIQNITLEGPGLMEMFLKERNISFEMRDLFAGDTLPDDPSVYGAVVLLGGPMNADEEEKYSFLKDEKEFAKNCIKSDTPMLGICLGAQLLARVFNARVYKNDTPEIGCMEVELTKQGRDSPLFMDTPPLMHVFQWHGDTFDLADGSYHLAQSRACQNQVFSIKNRFFGIQFHVEITLEEAKKWASSYLPSLKDEEKHSALSILQMEEKEWPKETQGTARKIFTNFFEKIAGLSGK